MADLVSELTILLYDVDPIRLRVAGAPEDEYLHEAEEIARRLRLSSGDLSDCTYIVYDTFVTSFNEKLAGWRSGYDDLGRTIWRLWLRERRRERPTKDEEATSS